MNPIFVLLFLTVSALAQQRVAPTITVEAKEVGSSKATTHNWETDYGSFDRDYKRDRSLSVIARNISSTSAGECMLDIYWLVKPLAPGKTAGIGYHESVPLVFGTLKEVPLQFTSPSLEGNVTKYAALGEKYASGVKLVGWVIKVSRGGKVVGEKAASEEQQRLANDEKKWSALLSEYAASAAGQKESRTAK